MCPAQHRRRGTVVVNPLPVVRHDSFSSKQIQNSIRETNHPTVANEASQTLQLQRGVAYHPPCAGLPRTKQENSSPFTGLLPSARCKQGAKSFHSKGWWSLAKRDFIFNPLNLLTDACCLLHVRVFLPGTVMLKYCISHTSQIGS